MKKVVKYDVISESKSLPDLSERINFLISEGWQPFGSPFTMDLKDETEIRYCLCQPMVKYEESEGE